MKFGSLLKKELGGLLTPQALISMVFTCVLLIAMGQIMGNTMDESFDTSEINVCNLDDSDYTKDMLDNLSEYGSTAKPFTLESDDYAAELERLGIDNLIIIPEGFGDSVLVDKKPAEVRYVCKLGMGFGGLMKSTSASDALSAIEASVGDSVLLDSYGLSEEEIERVNSPVLTVEYSTLNGKTAQVSSSILGSVLMTQSMIAPFVIFFLLLMASQMIMTAISTEKIDKTLETLLSAPVPRITILTAKMVAALVVAIIDALVMVVGMIGYIFGMMGSVGEEISSLSAEAASGVAADMSDAASLAQGMMDLGLTLGIGDYLLFGLQMFLSVLIGLALALILGALCEDVQSMNTLLMPIMILVMIPFFITMFMDTTAMDPVLKTILYIIPFSHSYMALNNLMTGSMVAFWGGLAYQIIFLIGTMFFAVKMFTTDKIFTMTGAIAQKKQQRQAAKK
ncbi:MAG: ABC transporter permease [Oscillospiraceae bacterium]|nr:ABC transporter permease [Oscillospiraceae bacterium]MDY2847451.1 ABC transporter permease [Oscillospiraceae bacterium]